MQSIFMSAFVSPLHPKKTLIYERQREASKTRNNKLGLAEKTKRTRGWFLRNESEIKIEKMRADKNAKFGVGKKIKSAVVFLEVVFWINFGNREFLIEIRELNEIREARFLR